MRIRQRWGGTTAAVLGWAVTLWLSSGRSGQAQGGASTPLPDDPARPVVERMCTSCHDLVIGEKQRYPRDRWAELVDQMWARGMAGTTEDAEIVIAYLTRYFGPEPTPGHQ